MKLHRITILTFLLLVSKNLEIQAQILTTNNSSTLTNAPQPGFGQSSFVRALNLTTNQMQQFTVIMQGRMEKIKSLHTNTDLTADKKRAQFRLIQDETATQIKAVLTGEQFEKWQKIGLQSHPAFSRTNRVSSQAPAPQ